MGRLSHAIEHASPCPKASLTSSKQKALKACTSKAFAGDSGSDRNQRPRSADRSVGARTDHFDLDAAVLGAASGRLVAGDRLGLALAFGVDAVALDALGHQI